MDGLVTVIIPVYKVEEYLDRCIESVVRQTYEKLEIILVDDGSPDLCPQKCDEWAELDNRIIVIHKENEGPGIARNSGLDIARGEYITFVDSDDYLSIDAINILVKRIEYDKSDLVLSKFAIVCRDGKMGGTFYSWMTDQVLDRNSTMQMFGDEICIIPVFPWGKLYKRCILKDVRFKSLKCGEDLYILPHILSACNFISVTKDVTYFYYQRETSVTHNTTETVIKDNINAYIHVASVLMDQGYINGASRYYYKAVCKAVGLKSKEELRIINKSFTGEDRKIFRMNIDKRSIKKLLMSRFPSLYSVYKVLANKQYK